MAGTKAATPRKSSKSRKSKSTPATKKPTKAAKAAPVSGTKALSSSSNAGLDRSTVQRAVAALLKHQANTAASKPAQLLDDTEYVHLVIGMRRIPDKGKNKPYPMYVCGYQRIWRAGGVGLRVDRATDVVWFGLQQQLSAAQPVQQGGPEPVPLRQGVWRVDCARAYLRRVGDVLLPTVHRTRASELWKTSWRSTQWLDSTRS